MCHATALAVGRADRAGARATGALLLIQLAGAALNFATAQRIASAEARICLLAHHRLVHHRHIRLDAEDIFGELDDPDFIAGLIEDFCFHRISSFSIVKSSKLRVKNCYAWRSELKTQNSTLLTRAGL